MQAAESHCWCNSSASHYKNNGGNGGMAEWQMADGMAEWQKEWQNGRMAGIDTYVLFMVHTDDTDDNNDDDDDDNNNDNDNNNDTF